jgi:hypothetical protein
MSGKHFIHRQPFQVYHNNFLNIEVNTGGAFLFLISFPQHTDVSSPPWDNGYPSGGNYWSDYASRYPDAVEIDSSGIGSVQYVSSTNSEVIDRYPLLAPYNIPQLTIPTQPNQSPLPSLTPSPSVPEFPVWVALLLIVVATMFTIFIGRKN